MLLHYADIFIVTPLVPVLMKEFNLNYTQTGLLGSGAIVVATLLFPVWGYLFDKYSRRKLCALEVSYGLLLRGFLHKVETSSNW